MKSIFVIGLLLCIVGSISFVVGQGRKREEKISTQKPDATSPKDQIEVMTDRFTREATLVLKPQILLDKPDHFVTLAIKTEVGKSDDPQLKVSLFSKVYIASQAKAPQDFGDIKAAFLVNDEPLTVKISMEGDYPILLEAKYYIEKGNMPLKRTYSGLLFEPQFKKFNEAEKIEMKFGAFETKFGQTVIANLREYARLVLKQLNEIGKQEKP
jgi:hypothetical protein